MREATVCHLLRQNGVGTEVLLGPRRSLFKNKIWNGPGGKMRKGEGVLACLKRETGEEIGIEIELSSATHFATLDAYHPHPTLGHTLEYRVYFLHVTRWKGEPRLTDEFWDLQWTPHDSMPYGQMMADVVAWMPLALSNKDPAKLLEVEIYYADNDLTKIEKGSFKLVEKPKRWPKRKL